MNLTQARKAARQGGPLRKVKKKVVSLREEMNRRVCLVWYCQLIRGESNKDKEGEGKKVGYPYL